MHKKHGKHGNPKKGSKIGLNPSPRVLRLPKCEEDHPGLARNSPGDRKQPLRVEKRVYVKHYFSKKSKNPAFFSKIEFLGGTQGSILGTPTPPRGRKSMFLNMFLDSYF